RLLPRAAERDRPAVVSRGGRHAAAAHRGSGAHRVVTDRALPRSEGPAREPADVLVLRDAHHLPDDDGAGHGADAAEPEPVHASGRLLPGAAVLRWPVRTLAVAARAAGRVDRTVLVRLLPL